MEERWAPIRESNGAYEVSDHGRVRNTKRNIMLSPRKTKAGYHRIHITYNGRRNDLYIHRLVAEYFCDHPEGCDVINHIDNNNQNNAFWNLEWTTQYLNVHHGMKQGRYKHNAIPVIGYKDGEKHYFDSAHSAGVITGCNPKNILSCCRNLRSQVKGFKWVFAEVS